jgi:hypothetical protein
MRGKVSRVEIESRIYKMKNELYNGTHCAKSGEWHDGAHDALNTVLEILKEYRE